MLFEFGEFGEFGHCHEQRQTKGRDKLHTLSLKEFSKVNKISELGTLREKSALLALRRRAQRPISRALLTMGLLMMMAASGQSVQATGEGQTTFKRIPTQFIAALGDPAATSGSGAQSWGLWRRDPGPRGVWLVKYWRRTQFWHSEGHTLRVRPKRRVLSIPMSLGLIPTKVLLSCQGLTIHVAYSRFLPKTGG